MRRSFGIAELVIETGSLAGNVSSRPSFQLLFHGVPVMRLPAFASAPSGTEGDRLVPVMARSVSSASMAAASISFAWETAFSLLRLPSAFCGQETETTSPLVPTNSTVEPALRRARDRPEFRRSASDSPLMDARRLADARPACSLPDWRRSTACRWETHIGKSQKAARPPRFLRPAGA